MSRVISKGATQALDEGKERGFGGFSKRGEPQAVAVPKGEIRVARDRILS